MKLLFMAGLIAFFFVGCQKEKDPWIAAGCTLVGTAGNIDACYTQCVNAGFSWVCHYDSDTRNCYCNNPDVE